METKSIKISPSGSEVKYLTLKDAALGRAVKKIGAIERRLGGDHFLCLCRNIVSQQISGLAAQSVWRKLGAILGSSKGGGAAKKILSSSDESLLACGLSRRKVSYLKAVASELDSGKLNFKQLEKLSDAQICERLTKLRGVGIWTAEMMLIFSYARQDVLSISDFGVRTGIMKLKKKKDMPQSDFEKLKKRYSPHGTAASIYFWAIADGAEF